MPQPDMDAFAETVVLTIKSAMAPLLERLAVSEQCNRDILARVQEFSGLRDRLTVLETKADLPVSAETVELGPALERIASVETRIELLGDVRERVAFVETKAALAPPVPVDVMDRLTAVEARVSVAELRIEMKAGEIVPFLTSLSDLTKDIGVMRERVAVVEVRGQVPGPAGKDGANGKDGADGMGWDDLSVEHDGERAFTVKMIRGDRVKDAGTFSIPAMIYRGVYTEGRTYEPGDTMTYAGSTWHCHKTTVMKPDTSGLDARGPQGKDFWTMVVKQGREGKPGRDGIDSRSTTPVVTLAKDRV